MDRTKKIFIDRLERENRKRASYNKYIYNSHLVMFLLIVTGAVAFNYSSWLKTAPIFQIYLVLGLVLAFMAYILTTVRVKTLIKDADAVFILALEKSYVEVIKNIISSTIILKTLISGLFILALYPIIQKLGYLNISIITLVISIIISNVFLSLYKQYKVVYDVFTIRDSVIIFVTYMIVNINFIFNIINFTFILAILLFINVKKITTNINWQAAAAYDDSRLEKYLKFINMFTDVSIDSVKVSRRRYLDILLAKIKDFSSENSYTYYFTRAFLRQENTIFLIVRLFVLALAIGISLNNIYVSLVVVLSFNYLSVIQLETFYKKINTSIWSQILPISEDIKIKSFKKMIVRIMVVFTSLLIIVFSIINFEINNFIYLLLVLLISIVLNKKLLAKVK